VRPVFRIGFGFTVITTSKGVPSQPFARGVTTYVTVAISAVIFVRTSVMGFVFPGDVLEPPPVTLALPDVPVTVGAGYQNVAPGTLLLKAIFIAKPLQIV
jgi:hypothetical protein